MRKFSAVVLGVAVLMVAGSLTLGGEGKRVEGKWSDFTVDQIAEHLGLTGGNIVFEFDQPVYLNIVAVQKRGKGGEVETVYENWSVSAGKKHDFFIKVHKNKSNDFELDDSIQFRQSAGGFSSGVRLRIVLPSETGNRQIDEEWRHSSTRLQIDETKMIYGFSSREAPEDVYFKLSIRFSAMKPSDTD